MDEPEDVELLRRIRRRGGGSQGEALRRAAFAALYVRHAKRGIELAFRVTGDFSHASDVVQDVFVSLYEKGAAFDERARFTSWLFRVIVNRAIDLRRRERRRSGERPKERGPAVTPGEDGAPEVESAASPSPGPEVEARSAERAEAVRAAVARLSPKLGEVVVLRYLQDLSYEEVGEILELPPGTVKSRLNRAHEALRELLGGWIEDAP